MTASTAPATACTEASKYRAVIEIAYTAPVIVHKEARTSYIEAVIAHIVPLHQHRG